MANIFLRFVDFVRATKNGVFRYVYMKINLKKYSLDIFLRFYWDLVMLILLLLNVLILPVAISFFNDNWSVTWLLIFNLVSDSMFLLDIGVNFRTGLLKEFNFDKI
jgi:hypothetical protein